ncbi:hypothetical protein BDZ94DRAFT_1303868 [Collybia nuda]|uniref:Uncharacterized protein n=1 Tax=Collybia nuda TaxID=64659 RepID=A0A9P5YKB7_9AGAR|nr:hypothetical protein BDZ94DRAFT_1303868 [Collybia nuda]
MFSHLGSICLLLFIFLERFILAVEVNRTIDDTVGDSVTGQRPVYLPQTIGVWEDATCKGCAIQPDKVQAFKGTWTAATYNPGLESMSVEFSFKGTAIYIFLILANTVAPGITTETACNFTLDGRPAGSFEHVPGPTADFQYNALAFSRHNLANVDHQFSISTSGLDRDIFVNFDYAIYTVDDAPVLPPPLSSASAGVPSSSITLPSSSSSLLDTSAPSQSSMPSTPSTPSVPIPSPPDITPPPLSNSERSNPSQIGAIAGGVIGGFIALVAMLLLFLFCRRRRQNIEQNDDEFPTIVPISTDYDSNNPHARFMGITPFVNPYTDRPDTEFIQNGTIYSPTTYSGAPQSTVYGTSTTHNSTHSFSTTYNHEPMDPTIVSTLPGGQIMMSADTSTGSVGSSVAPVPPAKAFLQSYTTEAVRKSRQMEIDRQMRVVKQEMRDLKTDFHMETSRRASVTTGGRSEETEMSDMREQIRMMKEQIEYLQAQQQSPWAQGLSDEPPPGYSARRPSIRR